MPYFNRKKGKARAERISGAAGQKTSCILYHPLRATIFYVSSHAFAYGSHALPTTPATIFLPSRQKAKKSLCQDPRTGPCLFHEGARRLPRPMERFLHNSSGAKRGRWGSGPLSDGTKKMISPRS
jgi:hypothetical protein